MITLVQAPDFKAMFTDISSEQRREYDFGAQGSVVIESPVWLAVSASGGHRVLSEDGVCHYVPPRWLEIRWTPKPGQPHFVA